MDFGYHDYVSLTTLLQKYARDFPTKAHLYSAGKSVENRELWVIALADSKPDEYVSMRPEAKYVGNMHGNEALGKEILMHLIDEMLFNPRSDPAIDYVMQNTRTHVMVSMNPDGFERGVEGQCQGLTGRYNANGYDLNRNFPDLFEKNEVTLQPETLAVMNWIENNNFIISANLHGGEVVANYPYDNLAVHSGMNTASLTTDQDVFMNMALNYSMNHKNMRFSPCGMETFTNGITNGAAWYKLKGGMQDYNYWKYGVAEITLEVSCCKYPPAYELQKHWEDNRDALVEFLKIANTGVRGTIRLHGEAQLPAAHVTVRINDREPYFKTNDRGEFYRVLMPGNYSMQVMLNCSPFYTLNFRVSPSTRLTQLDILIPEQQSQIVSKLLGSLDPHDKSNHYPVFCARGDQLSALESGNYFVGSASRVTTSLTLVVAYTAIASIFLL